MKISNHNAWKPTWSSGEVYVPFNNWYNNIIVVHLSEL